MTSIKGITIEIGAKTTSLDRALAGINSSARQISQNLRIVKEDLKLGQGDSLKKMSDAFDLAARKAKTFDEKIKAISLAYKKSDELLKSGNITQERYTEIQTALAEKLENIRLAQRLANSEMEDWREKLNQAKAEASAFNHGLDEVADGFDEIGESAEEAEEKTDGFATSLKANLSARAIANILSGVLSFFKNIATAAWNAGKAIAGSIKNYARDAINSAASLQEIISTNERVFGGWANYVERWAKDSAKNIGLAKQEALSYTNMIGQLLTNKGLDEWLAAHWSIALAQRAADVGAALDFNTDEVIQKIQAAVRGEYASIDSIGVILNATKVKARAVQDYLDEHNETIIGFAPAIAAYEAAQQKANEAVAKFGANSDEAIEANEDLLKAEKELNSITNQVAGSLEEQNFVIAAMQEIMDQTAKSADAFASESGGWNGLWKRISAESKNFLDEVGLRLLPVAEEVVGELLAFYDSPSGQSIVESLLSGVEELAQGFQDFLHSDYMKEFIEQWRPKLENFIEKAKTEIPRIADKLVMTLPTILEKFEGILGAVSDIERKLKAAQFSKLSDEEKMQTAQMELNKYAQSVGLGFEDVQKVLSGHEQLYGVKISDLLLDYYAYESSLRETMDNIVEVHENGMTRSAAAIEEGKVKISQTASELGFTYDDMMASILRFSKDNNIAVTEIMANWDFYKTSIIGNAEDITGAYEREFGKQKDEFGNLQTEVETKTGEVATAVNDMATESETAMNKFTSNVQNGVADAAKTDTSALESFGAKVAGIWQGIKDSVSGIINANSPDNPNNWYAQRIRNHRAAGGLVTAGVPYIVGERGQELFVPRIDGRILNAQQTQQVLNQSSSTDNSRHIGDVHVHVYGAGGVNARETAEAIGWEVRKKLRLSGV